MVDPVNEVVVGDGSILDVIKQAGGTTFLSYANRCPWIVHELSSQPGYTVFLPTNEAFKVLPRDIVDAMNSSAQVTEWYLRYHMALEVIHESQMIDNRRVPTAFKPPEVMDIPVQEMRFNVYRVWQGAEPRDGLTVQPVRLYTITINDEIRHAHVAAEFMSRDRTHDHAM
ncbi:uncharacterized protein [Diadema setosum]|uniref:uncharacterized protein n=1 Tax=Diadema setosum TaxID=31175 RepID=UPI003B3A3C98